MKVGEFELSEGGLQPPPGDTFLHSEAVGCVPGGPSFNVFGLRPLTLLSSPCGQVCRPRTHASWENAPSKAEQSQRVLEFRGQGSTSPGGAVT